MPHHAWQTLTRIHRHPRDAHIAFDEPTHKYYVNGSCQGNISCTGFIHEFFGHFDAKAIITKMKKGPKWATSKYYGKTDEEIMKEWSDNGKEASAAGTAMHFSIDMVYRRKSDGKFVIYDWKRSKEIKSDNPFGSGLPPLEHLPDTNYWHYTMQLNVYKWMLEKYYGLEVADLYLVILHPDQPSYRRMRLNIMTDEVEDMIECRRRAVEAGCKQSVILPIPDQAEEDRGKPLASFGFKF